MENGGPHTPEVSLIGRLGILFGLFFIMLLALSVLTPAIGAMGLSPRTEALIVASLQGILVFILPAYITARVISRAPIRTLTLCTPPSIIGVMGILLVYVIGLPFLNQLIFWNESLSLPVSLAGLEKSLREMEELARQSTDRLLATESVGGMISGVLIIGFLTGLAEELFFRGSVQKILVRGNMSNHLAIWLTAILFSAMHFQFFGFFPRLLLGAFFGYLFFWSGTIWSSVFAHALNNSLVVVTVWMQRRGLITFDIERLGVTDDTFPYIALVSLALLAVFLIFFRKKIFYRRGVKEIVEHNKYNTWQP